MSVAQPARSAPRGPWRMFVGATCVQVRGATGKLATMTRAWSKLAHPFLRPAGHPEVSVVLAGGLLLSAYPTPDDVVWLRDEHGVGSVISLQDDTDLAAKALRRQEIEAAWAGAGVAFRRFPAIDGDPESLALVLPVAVDHLEAEIARGACVLVHCNAGFNRAPTVAIAYLMRSRDWTFVQARDFVAERRACMPYRDAIERAFG